jgi:pimeloyl-ACP methyl ester carboxylesterase
MYVEESQKQAERSGLKIRVGKRRRQGALSSTWSVERVAEDGRVETTFEFLHWDDIARRHWNPGYARLYRLAFKTYWHWIVASDSLLRVFRISKWNFVTGVAPGVALFVLPLLAVAAGLGGYYLGKLGPGQLNWLPALSAAVGFAAVIALGWWLEQALGLGWLLRTYAFVVDRSLGKVPRLDERANLFAERIVSYVETADDDEILVVGHSLGANVAVSAMARALARKPQLCREHRKLALLTLGGSIPLQGMLPWAQPFRDELAQLAANDDLAWIDISAPQDIASFALLNPVAISGVAVNGQPPRRPQVVSARFKELLAPESYEAATWNVFRMHFQYLMASDRAALHVYLSVTTVPLRFLDRFRADEKQGKPPMNADERR